MRLAKRGFTLIELMVSIMILSIMMLFLYKSYAELNASNSILKTELHSVTSIQKLKKVIHLDFSLALKSSVKIENRETTEDAVFFQTSNSLHKRYNPYVTYIVKENKLYRLESLKRVDSYELASDSEFDIDYLGIVNNFRVYKSSHQNKELYLLDIGFKEFEDILMKVRVLNEF